MDVVVERCAGLDVHRDSVVATVRVPGKGKSRRRRAQQTRSFGTTIAQLERLADWLQDFGSDAGRDGASRCRRGATDCGTDRVIYKRLGGGAMAAITLQFEVGPETRELIERLAGKLSVEVELGPKTREVIEAFRKRGSSHAAPPR